MTPLSAAEILHKHNIAYIATKKNAYTTNCPSCGSGYLSVKIDKTGVQWFCHDCQKGGGEYFEQREPPRGKRTGNGDLGPIKASYPYTDEGDKL